MVQSVSGGNNVPHNPDYDVKKKNENEVQVFANGPQEVQSEPAKPLEAHKIDYTLFSKKDRDDANSFATQAIREIRKNAEELNANFPQNPYIVDYDSFPKPEDFAQFKKNAFNVWKERVTDWTIAQNDAMKTKENHNMQNVNNTIAAGFGVLGAQLGFSTEFIAAKLEKLGGDVNKLNSCLKKTQQAIIANDNRNAKEIMNQAVALFIAGEFNADVRTSVIENRINDTTEDIKDKITEASDETNKKIDKLIFTENLEAIQEKDAKNIKADIYRAWNNNQNKTKKIIDKVLDREGKDYDRTHFTDATQIESAAATNGMIENLNLTTLRKIHYQLKVEGLLE